MRVIGADRLVRLNECGYTVKVMGRFAFVRHYSKFSYSWFKRTMPIYDLMIVGQKTMSLDKAIEHKKEKRKPYRGSKSIDKTCRNHGGCTWCEENSKHKFIKQDRANLLDEEEISR